MLDSHVLFLNVDDRDKELVCFVNIFSESIDRRNGFEVEKNTFIHYVITVRLSRVNIHMRPLKALSNLKRVSCMTTETQFFLKSHLNP